MEQRHSTPSPLGGSGSVSAVQNGYAGQLQLHNAGLFNRLGIIELTLLLSVSIKRFASVKETRAIHTLKIANSTFPLSFSNNKWFAWKTKEWIPNPACMQADASCSQLVLNYSKYFRTTTFRAFDFNRLCVSCQHLKRVNSFFRLIFFNSYIFTPIYLK